MVGCNYSSILKINLFASCDKKEDEFWRDTMKRIIYGIIGWTIAIVLGVMHFLQKEINDFDSILYLIGTLIALTFIFSSSPKKER